MPVIRTGTIHYEQGTYKQVVKYKVREKRFSIILPEWTHEYLGYDTVYGETLDRVDTAFAVAMREYDELARYKKRVIVYDFKANAFIWNEDKTRCIFRKEEISFSKGTGLSFWYNVLDERQAPGEKHKKYYLLDGRYAQADWHDSLKVIEWTKDRENFCKALETGLEQMIMNAWEFFNQEPDKIAQLIDSGLKLLPEPNKTSVQEEEIDASNCEM